MAATNNRHQKLEQQVCRVDIRLEINLIFPITKFDIKKMYMMLWQIQLQLQFDYRFDGSC